MKKYRKFGYEGLEEVYVKARKEGYSPTYDSMCKIIRKMKDNAKEKLKKLHKRKKKIEQAKYPGERVQIDIKYVPEECIKFGTRDQKYYQITALDEYTRKRVLRIADEKSTYQTAKFLENLEKELGFDIKKVQTDKGKEFTNSERDKKFKSKEELLRSIKKYNTRYNNISRKVLGFKSPNEVLKEYKENQ